jgi:hypothetical protein
MSQIRHSTMFESTSVITESVLVSCHCYAFSMQAVREEQGDAVPFVDGDEMACHFKIMKASGFA